MRRREINFGIIGLGLMGREFASAVARWPHLLTDDPRPVLRGICDVNRESWPWYMEGFPGIRRATEDYRRLLEDEDIEAVYCAVPHHLHEGIYVDIINAGKHLLGEKPFGIDREANGRIVAAAEGRKELRVRCNSEFPYFPACQRLIGWIREGRYGELINVRAGFNHSSDMDPTKPVNWKRRVESNGEYGCMGDLGMHVLHVPLRMGWAPEWVFADLRNITERRPDGHGGWAVCDTWDNAVLTCGCRDGATGKGFPMVLEMKRMAPGATNDWFLEVYGTEGSARFSTSNPRAFYWLESRGREQGWTRVDCGSQSAIASITGRIFEFGFPDAFQQMLGAFMNEFSERPEKHPFRTVTLGETALSHLVFSAALESHRTGRRVEIGR
ncbi:MAG: Gfo/Idh/MocA family oxidoreductase [Tannerella sp.]|jgi:predicted dehydrogenase|nr:Gfo/Idh/MocA family oxidoreductase [Tannerella sp.]